VDPLARAKEDLKKTEEAIRQGRWEDFGKSMQELKQSLDALYNAKSDPRDWNRAQD
jgi:hypothetical protein